LGHFVKAFQNARQSAVGQSSHLRFNNRTVDKLNLETVKDKEPKEGWGGRL